MEEARKAVIAKEYRHAIRIYTRLIEHRDNPSAQLALEYLGATRERNGQLAQAKAVYEHYLTRHPEGEGSARVRQRLAALITAPEQPKEKLRVAKRREQSAEWNLFGGFSQFYRRDVNTIDENEQTINQSAIATDIDFTARRRSQSSEFRTRFTGGYLHDLLDSGAGDESRISSLYFSAADRDLGLSTQIGRQTRSSGGVLGRYDGGLFSYQTTSWGKLNLVAGYPVDRTTDTLQTDRHFYGISADLGTFANAIDINPFFIEQVVDGITDRRAVGTELRYFHPERSLLGLIDYDLSYDILNTAMLLGNWNISGRTMLNFTFDHRLSPVLTTRNALQGQSVSSIDQLLTTLSEAEVRQLAKDRTARSNSVVVGLSTPVSEQLQLSGDITATNLQGTATSGGVAAVPGTGNEYYYNLQVMGSNLIKRGDTAIVGLRYANASSADTTTLSLNTRYPVNELWRINPRLKVSYRESKSNNQTAWTVTPALRMDYRWLRRVHFEFELSGDWSTEQLATTTSSSQGYYLNAGFRIDF